MWGRRNERSVSRSIELGSVREEKVGGLGLVKLIWGMGLLVGGS